MAIPPRQSEQAATSPRCDTISSTHSHNDQYNGSIGAPASVIESLQISAGSIHNNRHDNSRPVHTDEISAPDVALSASPPPQHLPYGVSSSTTKSSSPQTTTRLDHNSGIDLWHKWIARQKGAQSANANARVSPCFLLEYLDSVVLPLAAAPDQAPSTDDAGATALIRTYIRPVLELWQNQVQADLESTSHGGPGLSETSSSTTPLPLNECFPAARSMGTQRHQDHARRLSQLEQSHRDAAILLSQLQDKVERPLSEQSSRSQGHQQGQLQGDTGAPDGFDQAPVNGPSLSGESRSRFFATALDHSSTPSSHISKEDQASRIEGDIRVRSRELQPRHWHWHPSRPGRHDVEQCLADELIAVIARGLEEYHARSSRVPMERHYPRNGVFRSHDEDHLPDDPLQLPRPTMSQSPEPPTTLSPGNTPLSRPYAGTVSHSQHAPYDSYPHLSQRHAGFQQDDFLLPSQRDLNTMRSRKRSSSMGGPDALVRENIKLPRSCSPSRRRTESGSNSAELSLAMTPNRTSSTVKHTQSQPPSSTSLPPKEAPSALSNHYADAAFARGHAGQHSQHVLRPTTIHKYSHSSHPPGQVQFVEEEEEECAPYRQHTPQDHRMAHQHAEDTPNSLAFGPRRDPMDHHYSPYFQSATDIPLYRGRGHVKNQGSLSSQYSTLQHPFQHSENRICQGYDHHHEVAQLTHSYRDEQDKDVKMPYHYHHHAIQNQSQYLHHHHQSQQKQLHHRQEAPQPIYVMNRQVNTVQDLWKEWTVGLGPGNPSIRELEAQYGPSWRTSSSAANFFSRRLRIINEIQRLIDFEGLREEDAVNRLETRREQGVVVPGTEGATGADGQPVQSSGMSLHRLSEILRKKQL